MEELGPKEGRVGAAEDGQRLHDPDVLREPGCHWWEFGERCD